MSRPPSFVLSLVLPLVLLPWLPWLATAGPAVAATRAADADGGAVVARMTIGQSVQGRDIVAYRLGEPDVPDQPRVVLLAAMHGNEQAPRQILRSLVAGGEIVGVDLWVVPTYNPDGVAAGSRRNAHGVDLNRNFPHNWAELDGNYESGPRPASEPETRAVMGFLRNVRPDWILSFHQPLDGVDTDTKRPGFARRVARALQLPRKTFDCGSTCHGTLTQWYNATFAGAALTVEYGARPGARRMHDVAPGQVLSIFRAARGRLGTSRWAPSPEDM